MPLTYLDYQPDYPEVDLTEKNAEFFEYYLQNSALVEQSHPEAEANNKLFYAAHLVVKHSKDIFYDDSAYAGFTHGFTLYEIISALVAPTHDPDLQLAVLEFSTRQLTAALNGEKLDVYLNDAFDEFLDSQPTTAEVITRASKRYHPGLARYAVMGAAIERQFEIETKAFAKSIIQ